MWSEEEMRWIESELELELEPEPEHEAPEIPEPPPRLRSRAAPLRRVISERGLAQLAGTHSASHEVTRGAVPSVIHAATEDGHGNFMDASYRSISANPAWRRRLEKVHTSTRQARPTGPQEEVRVWRELDAATSSDALLMNIFCYPRVLARPALMALLGLDGGERPEFGFHPRVSLVRDLVDRTEIDMRLGSLLVEAKLTEGDFQMAPLRLLERYVGFDSVFDRDALSIANGKVRSYQLLRGVLAAHAADARFCVMVDARRVDLVEDWFAVMAAVKSFGLRGRLQLLTWQEIAATLPKALRGFLELKYGITRAG